MPRGWFGQRKRHSVASKKGWRNRPRGTPLSKARIRAIQGQRSRKALLLDNPVRHKTVVKMDSQRTRAWAKSPGSMDVEGVDDPKTTGKKEHKKDVFIPNNYAKNIFKNNPIRSNEIITFMGYGKREPHGIDRDIWGEEFLKAVRDGYLNISDSNYPPYENKITKRKVDGQTEYYLMRTFKGYNEKQFNQFLDTRSEIPPIIEVNMRRGANKPTFRTENQLEYSSYEFRIA